MRREVQERVLRAPKEEKKGWRLRSRGQKVGGKEVRVEVGRGHRFWKPSETVSRRREGPLDTNPPRGPRR